MVMVTVVVTSLLAVKAASTNSPGAAQAVAAPHVQHTAKAVRRLLRRDHVHNNNAENVSKTPRRARLADPSTSAHVTSPALRQ